MQPASEDVAHAIGRSLQEILSEHAAAVGAEMAAVVEEEIDDAGLRRAIGYHLGFLDADFHPPPPGRRAGGGKQLRSALVLLAYRAALAGTDLEAGRSELDRVLPLAAAVELLHNYSLVHDDIEDGDRWRRGRPTLWVVLGEAQAINAGDCLHALAFRCLTRLAGRGLEPGRATQVGAVMAEASVRLTVGQHRDLDFERSGEADLDRYGEMIAAKTAALMSAATTCGALAALEAADGHRQAVLAAYSRFGHHLGMAFQIRDDILGIWGTPADTGKPSGGDIRRRKKTLPILFALAHAVPGARAEMAAIYERSSPVSADDEAVVRAAIEGCGARKFTDAELHRHRDLAVAALDEAEVTGTGVGEHNPFLWQLERLTMLLTDRSS